MTPSRSLTSQRSAPSAERLSGRSTPSRLHIPLSWLAAGIVSADGARSTNSSTVRTCPDGKPCRIDIKLLFDGSFMYWHCRHCVIIIDKCPLETQYAGEKRGFGNLSKFMRKEE